MNTFADMAGWGYVFVFLFFVVLLIAWIVLPFAIIGTRPILRDLLEEARKMNAHLHGVENAARYLAEVEQERVKALEHASRRTP